MVTKTVLMPSVSADRRLGRRGDRVGEELRLDGVAKEGAKALGCGSARIPEIELVMATPRSEARFHDALVQPLDR
jgi:hypothetical protein